MGPSLYMQSVDDKNIVMWHITLENGEKYTYSWIRRLNSDKNANCPQTDL